MPNLDTGNTGFILLCTSLVMLMTPGLAFFYGGLVGRRNVLAIMMQSYVSMGWTTVLWAIVGYSLCFSGGEGGIIGNLDLAFLTNVTLDTPSPQNDTVAQHKAMATDSVGVATVESILARIARTSGKRCCQHSNSAVFSCAAIPPPASSAACA